MAKNTKGLKLGERHEWFTLALLAAFGLLILDASYSGGLFSPKPGKGIDLTAQSVECLKSIRPAGPATSVVHVQPNFHIVAPGIWRSAKLTPESLKRMKSYGLKTIVDLRLMEEAEFWEDKRIKELGVQGYRFPFVAGKAVPAKTVDAVLSILSDPARQPVLVHCANGKDRTGMMMAAYRIAQKDWAFKDIYQEMMMYGYEDVRFPAMLESLRLWSGERGYLGMAQEVAVTEQKVAEKKVKEEDEKKTPALPTQPLKV